MRINPWRVDLLDEINKISKLLEKEVNFIIAGYAADNAAFIYKRKIDTIEKITKVRKMDYSRGQEELVVRIPEIKVDVPVGKSYIDLGDVLDRLEEIIEEKLRKTVTAEEENISLIEYYSNLANIEEKAKEIGILIKKAYVLFKRRLLLTDIIKTLDTYSPYLIIFAILFLYVDEEIDIDIIEEDGIAKDIIIIPIK